VNTSMEGALRVITVERGYDPVDATLVSFGGAAGMHAVELAVRLGLPRILLPRDPGLLSAHGMLVSPVRKDAARTVLVRSDTKSVKQLDAAFRELERTIVVAMQEDGIARKDVRLERAIDARYRGQSFELRVPADNWVDAFHEAHRVRYGYAQPATVVEAVTLRVVGTAEAPPAPDRPLRRSRKKAVGEPLTVWWAGRARRAVRIARSDLLSGQRVDGPAVITEYSSTTWLPSGWSARADDFGNLVAAKDKSDR
jgi:N-methylhydantoinase A